MKMTKIIGKSLFRLKTLFLFFVCNTNLTNANLFPLFFYCPKENGELDLPSSGEFNMPIFVVVTDFPFFLLLDLFSARSHLPPFTNLKGRNCF